MKSIIILSLILITMLLISCAGTDQTAAEQELSAPIRPTSALNEAYPEALPIRNQLTLGTLRLEDDPATAVTPEQAAKLLPLWQGFRSLTGSGTGATAEINTLLAQIEGEMTSEQLQAIKTMKLTRSDIQAVAQEWGITTSTSGSQPGSGANLSEAERATRQAERAASGEAAGGVSTALLDRLIQLLQERAK